jgi:hypothetical protein
MCQSSGKLPTNFINNSALKQNWVLIVTLESKGISIPDSQVPTIQMLPVFTAQVSNDYTRQLCRLVKTIFANEN